MERVDSKRYMFEIIMTNGKRKVLAAETAELRKEWVGYLWQAMHLSSSGLFGLRNTCPHVSEQRDRVNSSALICSDADSVMETLPPRPVSVPGPQSLIQPETSIASSICTSEQPEYEEPTYQNIELKRKPQQCNDGCLTDPQQPSGVSNVEDGQEGDYDVLPLRKNVCESNPATEMHEGVYDFPISYRVAADVQEPTESIYDVPSALVRMPDDTTEECPEEGAYWRI
ncbi:uncharacterized protein LOC115424598 [Sphaeramia orbicularis]|uniref:uncharacterized protein LOC115424598 n=1 Tax=Sphaeramia orbicularis TaxID=375764 RepID=UPI0011814F21|nr:uncharacterized protein LOC115424598 [Sphaeramia orbicularis]